MANENYRAEGATIVFGSEPTDDIDWSTESTADGSGQQSAQHDWGAAPRPDELRIRFYTQLQAATPILGNTVDLYGKTGDHATLHLDNDEGNTDAAVVSADKLLNLKDIGAARVDDVAADTELVYSGTWFNTSQFLQLVLWNGSGAATSADVAVTKCEVTPIYYQGQ